MFLCVRYPLLSARTPARTPKPFTTTQHTLFLTLQASIFKSASLRALFELIRVITSVIHSIRVITSVIHSKRVFTSVLSPDFSFLCVYGQAKPCANFSHEHFSIVTFARSPRKTQGEVSEFIVFEFCTHYARNTSNDWQSQ